MSDEDKFLETMNLLSNDESKADVDDVTVVVGKFVVDVADATVAVG